MIELLSELSQIFYNRRGKYTTSSLIEERPEEVCEYGVRTGTQWYN